MRRVPRAANEKETFAGMNITAIGRQEKASDGSYGILVME